MGPRLLDTAMTDEDYQALKTKLLETFSVRPTLLNPMMKSRVDWHCLETSCFLDRTVFDSREKWMRHHQRLHNRMCGSDGVYPKEIEAKQFIHEYELRENARLGFAGAGGSSGRLMPPTATPAGARSRVSRALSAIPLNSAAPSSSISGALRGGSPNSTAPNSPRSGALRNSVAGRRRGPYRPRAIKAAAPLRHEHPDQGFVSIAGALQDEPESSRSLDADKREILMQQLSYNLQAVSQINTDSLRIMQILGLPSAHCVPESRIPAESQHPTESLIGGAHGYPATTVATPVPLPNWVYRRARGLQAGLGPKFVDPAHSNEGPAHAFETPRPVFEATPHLRQAPAHSNEGPAQAFETPRPVFEATPHSNEGSAHFYEAILHPSQALAIALPTLGQTNSYEGPALSIGPPPHPHQAPVLSIEGPRQLAPTYMTPSHSEEKEEEGNYNEASGSEELDSHNEEQPPIYRSPDVYEGAARFWP